MHALIIEDDEMIAMAIEDILRDCDFSSFAIAVSFDVQLPQRPNEVPS